MWRRLVQPSIAARGQQRLAMSTRSAPAETITALKDLLGDRLSTAGSILEVGWPRVYEADGEVAGV